MAIKIMGRNILLKEIKEEDKEEKSKGGLFIPMTAKSPKTILKGEVVSFGVDCKHVKEGDIIYFNIHSAGDVVLENENYVIVDENSIFAIDS